MTQDFAKPSTTRKPGDKRKPGPKSSTSKKENKAKTKKNSGGTQKTSSVKKTTSKGASSASLKPSQHEAAPTTNRLKPIISLIVLVSAFAYGLYYLQSVPPTQSPINTELNQKNTQAAKTQDKPQAKTPGARFKFYDLLPQSNVKAPEVDTYRYKAKNRPSEYTYYVQTGSFRSKKDAERQKATIAFQGIKAKIKEITSDSGTTWYRVTAGPYTNRSKMNSTLDKLVALNIAPLVKKYKKK